MRAQTLLDVIEAIKTHYESNSELFLEVVEIFARSGFTVDDLGECYGFDDVLDDVLDEYENANDDAYEDEDDEWPDGGREDF